MCCNTSTLTVHWHVLQVRGKKFSFIVPLFDLPLSRATTLTLLTRSSCGFRSISLCLDSRESRRGARPSMLLKRGHGSPPVTEFASTTTLIVAPTPTFTFVPPIRDNTPDLSSLSNPFACRVEWFKCLGNSLNFPHRLSPSSPCHPPPPPPPPPPVTSTAPVPSTPSSDSPTSSCDSPHPPPLYSICSCCAEKDAFKESTDAIK